MFKVGDKVIQLATCGNTEKGGIYTVSEDTTGLVIHGNENSHERDCHCSGQWKLIESSNNTMSNLTEKFALAVMTEPEKSLRKAGITNGDNLLTEEGQKVFLSWLLSKSAADFKKEVVDPILAEEDKK